jgi:hypothetical protein
MLLRNMLAKTRSTLHDGFVAKVPHTGTGKHPEQPLIRHEFEGSWRVSGKKEHEI